MVTISICAGVILAAIITAVVGDQHYKKMKEPVLRSTIEAEVDEYFSHLHLFFLDQEEEMWRQVTLLQLEISTLEKLRTEAAGHRIAKLEGFQLEFEERIKKNRDELKELKEEHMHRKLLGRNIIPEPGD